MTVLCIGNVKGGVGKTMLSVNLAIALALEGRDVLLVDGDEQATALGFTQLRAEKCPELPRYTAIALSGAGLRTQVRQLKPKYPDIVIDVGGRDTGSFRAALTVADTLLVPVQPRSFDVWAVAAVASLVKEARELNDALQAYSVLNAADPTGQDNAEAAAVLQELEGIRYLDCPIVRRKAFPNAAAAGKSVLEYGDEKAAGELGRLVGLLSIDSKSY